jgi:FAD/FMN-containing dehydrogenase
MTPHHPAAHDLRQIFRGPVHEPGDPDYEAQRVTWSKAIDPWPAVVAEALTPIDVRMAVVAARVHGLPFAVQGTGHGTYVPADGGLLLKTGRMAEVLIDPDRRIARVGPGATWGDVIAAAAPCGLAPLSGSSTSVGVAGYTLGGGLSWLSRKFGFAADSLVRADVVTADGDLLSASADRNEDLFWALRGGGAGFGVVTRLEFRLHPVARVYAGTAYFPIGRAAATIARLRDWADAQPDELTASIVLMREAPEDVGVAGPVLAIRGLYAGEPGDAVRALRPLWEAAGTPVAPRFRPMAYTETGTIGGTAPRQFELFADLPDALIDAAVELVAGPEPAANEVEVRHWGGAMARPSADAGPTGHRDVPFSMTIEGGPEALATVAPYGTGGTFLNFVRDRNRVPDAFTPANYERLRDIKRTYDPDDLFSVGHTIAPSAAAELVAA